MGLDMYLTGERYLHGDLRRIPGQLKATRHELGYWRKHPNLHGYIVQAFADGTDDCRPVNLSEEQIVQLMEAIRKHELPDTSGFFFGESDGSDEEVAEDLKTLQFALDWLRTKEEGVWRSVEYQASW